MVFPQTLEDLRNVLAMFGQAPGVYENVVYVNDDKPMEELPEHLMYKALED